MLVNKGKQTEGLTTVEECYITLSVIRLDQVLVSVLCQVRPCFCRAIHRGNPNKGELWRVSASLPPDARFYSFTRHETTWPAVCETDGPVLAN